MQSFTIAINDLSISLQDIYNEMGYISIAPDPTTISETESIYNEVSGLLVPRCNYTIVSGRIEGEKIVIEDKFCFTVGATIAKLLANSGKFAIFTATASVEFETYQHMAHIKSDILKAYIVDTLGSLIAERAGDYMERQLEEEIAPLKHTNRLSPGYCGWDITEQRLLFEYLGNETCGITLSESCLMKPIKSISGVVGIGESVDEKTYACKFCELKTCYKRKLRK